MIMIVRNWQPMCLEVEAEADGPGSTRNQTLWRKMKCMIYGLFISSRTQISRAKDGHSKESCILQPLQWDLL